MRTIDLFSDHSAILASWVQGIGTVLAVFAALIISWIEYRLQKRDQRKAANSQQEQEARLLTGWITSREVDRSDTGTIVCQLRNLGLTPAYDVRAWIESPDARKLTNFDRVNDVIIPEGTAWSPMWMGKRDDALFFEPFPELVFQYRLNGKSWLNRQSLVTENPLRNPSGNWERHLSIAWSTLAEEPYRQDRIVEHRVSAFSSFLYEITLTSFDESQEKVLSKLKKLPQKIQNKINEEMVFMAISRDAYGDNVAFKQQSKRDLVSTEQLIAEIQESWTFAASVHQPFLTKLKRWMKIATLKKPDINV